MSQAAGLGTMATMVFGEVLDLFFLRVADRSPDGPDSVETS